MITPTYVKNYKTSDGTIFKTIEEAQLREIELFFSNSSINADIKAGHNPTPALLAQFICKNKDSILDILTITDKTKLKISHKKKDPKKIEGQSLTDIIGGVPIIK